MGTLAVASVLGYAGSNRSTEPVAPFTCLVAGDGIALGLGTALTECTVEAGVGRHVKDVALPGNASVVVIAVGETSKRSPTLWAEVRALRARAGKRKVVWVLPVNPLVRDAIASVAREHGDRYVAYASKREVPDSYDKVAAAVRTVYHD